MQVIKIVDTIKIGTVVERTLVEEAVAEKLADHNNRQAGFFWLIYP
jgi:hypothetical protein